MPEAPAAAPLSKLAKTILLEGDLAAQRMVATWDLAGEWWPHTAEGEVALDGDGLEEAAERWQEVSGVFSQDILRLMPALVRNGILLPKGEAWKDAVDYVRAVVASRLRSGAARRR